MAEPLRVFQLIKGLGRGGAEQLLLAAARRPGDTRYAVGFFVPRKDALVGSLRDSGVEVLCFGASGGGGMVLRVPRITRFLRRWKADVLHCHLPLAGVVGRFAGRLAGVPVVYTEHNLMERYHPWTRRANLLTWRLQERVVAVSQVVADSIRAHAGDRVPVEVVENGIDVQGFEPHFEDRQRVRQHLGIPLDAPLVGQVAVFRRQKRLDLWLETAAGIAERRPDARFLLVGDGPLRGEVGRRVVNLGLADRVVLPGLQEDPRPYYAAMDVFLLSSDYEGLPLSVLEAMATGLPVVTTAVGGLPGVVNEGSTGFLVPPGRPELLAERTLTLLDDPAAGARMGEAGRRRVAERFSLDRMVRRLEGIYHEVIAEHRRGR